MSFTPDILCKALYNLTFHIKTKWESDLRMRAIDDPWVVDRRMQELIFGIDDVYELLSPNQKVKALYAIVKLRLPFYEVIQKAIF